MQDKIVPIVFCTNHNYAKYAAVAIASIKENCAKNVAYKIFIFHDEELSEEDAALLQSMSEKNIVVQCKNVSSMIDKKKLYSRAHYSKQMFYRLLIPEALAEFEKVVYLDCDIVVLDDVQKLFDMQMEDNLLGAVRNPLSDEHKEYVEKILNLTTYVNSGVLVFNNKKCLEFNLKEKCLSLLQNSHQFICPDQDVINLICQSQIKTLPSNWNFQWHETYPKEELAQRQSIIHFTSNVKPWLANGAENPFAQYFWQYAKLCPFFDQIQDTFNKSKSEKKNSSLLKLLIYPFKTFANILISFKRLGFKITFLKLKYRFKKFFCKKRRSLLLL